MKICDATGWKNSGKTGLMERLVAEIAQRGLTVSTVKHPHHDTETGHPGSDSFRHRTAGVSEVMLSSLRRWALMHELRDAPEPQLADMLTRSNPTVKAVASDTSPEGLEQPVFPLDDTTGIAEFTLGDPGLSA